MKLYFPAILILFVIFSCNDDRANSKMDYAYFGGEIINPNSKFVILEKNEETADTIRLDGRNRFIYKIENLQKGLYTFRHGGEYQLILLEPEDSVLFRLNTLEFDESLVYTGKGAKKNNYIINEFLENEKNEKYILKLCQLKPKAYQKHIDSLRAKKLQKLERFNKKYGGSDLFNKIAKANINYSYYSSKEVYPFVHYGRNKGKFLKSLPKDFYSYRKHINYNDTFFKNYPIYQTFLRHNINTISLETHSNHSNEKGFNWGGLCYNLDRLHLVDSLIKNDDIKNQLLHHYALKYISLSNNKENNSIILKSYVNRSTDKKAKTTLTNYANSLKKLEIGSTLPSFKVLDYNNKEFEINSLVESPTVVSFWSHIYYDHFKKSQRKIKELKKKYPEVKFITINIDNIDAEKPKQTLKECRFKYNDQYLFKTPKETTEMLAVYPMTKTILLDENKKIVSPNSNMFTRNFEQQLLGLINR
ncbi:hypothetical protein J1D01_11175 [Seonamhaeicola sp. NFXS20]|uniref:TlpA family protein disulfide reductase n=1 Tax=Seonamhaeicola sp. NFXS20 TaxID=2816959 RepID=UPI003B8DC0E0